MMSMTRSIRTIALGFATGLALGAAARAASVPAQPAAEPPTAAGARPQTSLDAPFTAVVGADEATFVVPVGARAKWEWDQRGSGDDFGEYVWQVAAENGGERYTFGFYHFKSAKRPPQSGDLAALLRAGQQSLFQAAEGGLVLVEGAVVSVEPAGEDVVIRLKGKETVDKVFSAHPAEVKFQLQTAGERPVIRSAKVTYAPTAHP